MVDEDEKICPVCCGSGMSRNGPVGLYNCERCGGWGSLPIKEEEDVCSF